MERLKLWSMAERPLLATTGILSSVVSIVSNPNEVKNNGKYKQVWRRSR